MAFDYTDPSWTHGREMTVRGATDRISRMLAKAYISVQAVTRDNAANATYINHFNDPGHAQLGLVQNTIRRMHNRAALATQVVHMIYVPNAAAFAGLGVGALPAGVVFAQVEAFVNQANVLPANVLNVFVGPAFFTGNVYLPGALNQRTGTGTILHELSHGVAGTADHAYTWAAGYAALTAAQRATNADTYRAYCQTFDP